MSRMEMKLVQINASSVSYHSILLCFETVHVELCTAGVARGEVGQPVDAADRLQVVVGAVTQAIARRRQVRLKIHVFN